MIVRCCAKGPDCRTPSFQEVTRPVQRIAQGKHGRGGKSVAPRVKPAKKVGKTRVVRY